MVGIAYLPVAFGSPGPFDKKIFAVQYHPEASPGPHDSQYLFQKFKRMVNSNA